MKLSFVNDIKKCHKSCGKYEGIKRYIDTGNVKETKIVGFEEYTYDQKPSRANICVKAGDVLVAKMQNSIKVLVIDEEMEDYVFSTGFYAFRDKRILPAFLKYFFLSPYFNHEKNIKCTGGTQKAINDEGMKKIFINVPSLEEQAKFVVKLDLISEAIECEENRIQLYEELISSKFIEMFGDPVLNPMGWEKCQLAEKCDISTGNTPSRKIPEYYGDYIEWIKSDNINTAFINLTEAVEYLSEKGLEKGRSVEVGSILMTCIAGSVKCIGNVGIADRKVAFNQQINGISPRNNNTYFMYEQFILAKQYIQSHIKMAVKGMLNKTQLSKLEFIFPPIEKQNKFGAFMEEVHSLIDDGYYQLEKLNELLATEMHKYFD